MLTVYLAGKMGGRRASDVLQERHYAISVCKNADLIPIDPAANEHIVWSDQIIDMSLDHLTMKHFVAKDKWAVEHCDVLLVLTGDTPSDGTSWEMGWAAQKGIPVILVAPKRHAGTLMSFSNILATALFSNVDDAVEFIAQNYGGLKQWIA